MANFTRKHYQQVANILNRHYQSVPTDEIETIRDMASDFADMFAADNENFKRSQFINACFYSE